ncbi:MAG: IS1595 family transposase [Aggregatilineales bacterium]
MNIVEVYRKFPTEDDCIAYLEEVRWHGTPVCPYCHSDHTTPLPDEHRHHCNTCNTTFSVTVGTIFHHTHLPLQKWFLAISLILNAKKAIAARQLGRDLEVTKDTAWSLAMRIRKAMSEAGQRELLQGLVEMDEPYVGGKPRKENDKGSSGQSKRGRGTDKTPVVGMVQRGGKVRTKVMLDKKLTSKVLSSVARANIDTSVETTLITDEYAGYSGIIRFMSHQTVNHKIEYVNGDWHTNNLESFWALFKRGFIGQYHQLSKYYLNKYFDEFCYRHNYRDHSDLFALTVSRGLGV